MDQELSARLKKVEDNVNACTAANLALMAAFSALPDAGKTDARKAEILLSGLVNQQGSLAALKTSASAFLATILANAAEAARH